MEVCLPELPLCRDACGDANRPAISASAGGGGSGGGGWLGSRGRFEADEPDEEEVMEASVCSGIKTVALFVGGKSFGRHA
jgi:hypothetical protein